MGRPTGPTKLTASVQARICRALADTNVWRHAASAAGVHTDTVRDWFDAGRADHEAGRDTLLAGFFRAVEKARADWEARLVLVIDRASQQSWQAAAWLLERKLPGDYARREKIDLDLDGLIERELARLAGAVPPNDAAPSAVVNLDNSGEPGNTSG